MFKPYFIKGETFLIKFISKKTCDIFTNDGQYFVIQFDYANQAEEFAKYASNVDELTIKYIIPVDDSYHPGAPKYDVICDDTKYLAQTPVGSNESNSIAYLRARTDYMEDKMQDQDMEIKSLRGYIDSTDDSLFALKLFIMFVMMCGAVYALGM